MSDSWYGSVYVCFDGLKVLTARESIFIRLFLGILKFSSSMPLPELFIWSLVSKLSFYSSIML